MRSLEGSIEQHSSENRNGRKSGPGRQEIEAHRTANGLEEVDDERNVVSGGAELHGMHEMRRDSVAR